MRAKERESELCSGTILENILRILKMVWDTYLTPYVVSNNACLCLSINANIKQLNKGDFMSVASLKCDKSLKHPQ